MLSGQDKQQHHWEQEWKWKAESHVHPYLNNYHEPETRMLIKTAKLVDMINEVIKRVAYALIN